MFDYSDYEFRRYDSIEAIKTATHNLGNSFFGREEMRFFNCRVGRRIHGGRFFVTSEKGPGDARRYSVRVMGRYPSQLTGLPTASVIGLGGFQAFGSSNGAHKFAAKLAGLVEEGWTPNEVVREYAS